MISEDEDEHWGKTWTFNAEDETWRTNQRSMLVRAGTMLGVFRMTLPGKLR